MSRGRLVLATLVCCAILCASSACTQPESAALAPRSLVILPPVSARLDPLVPEGHPGLREADRQQIVDVVETVLPNEVHDRLIARGLRAVVIRPDDLSRAATESEDLEDRLSYAGMARAYDVDRVLKLAYDGTIRHGAGTVEWLGGLIAMDYPSDTSWFDLHLEATLVDPSSSENLQTLTVSGTRHSELFTMLGGTSERDRMAGLTQELADELVDRLLGP